MSPTWPWSPPPAVKKCRYCFQEIPGEAEVCPLCGETLVRVSPQMVKTLILALALGFFLMAASAFWRSLWSDPQAVQEQSYSRGLALGHEAGQRQGRWDAAQELSSPRETFPANLRMFLRNKDRHFREGFEKGFVQTYYESFEKNRGPRPEEP